MMILILLYFSFYAKWKLDFFKFYYFILNFLNCFYFFLIVNILIYNLGKQIVFLFKIFLNALIYHDFNLSPWENLRKYNFFNKFYFLLFLLFNL